MEHLSEFEVRCKLPCSPFFKGFGIVIFVCGCVCDTYLKSVFGVEDFLGNVIAVGGGNLYAE